MDAEKALIEAGYNVSSLEGEMNRHDFPVVAYGDGSDFDLEGTGTLDWSWVEPEPPEFQTRMTTTVMPAVVGQYNGQDVEFNADVTVEVVALSVESMELELEGQKVPVWHCRAKVRWDSDFAW